MDPICLYCDAERITETNITVILHQDNCDYPKDGLAYGGQQS